MSGTQREMLMSLITEYVNQVRQDVAADKLAAIEEQGIDDFSLAWGGPVEKDKEHYYRIYGGKFVVEYINRQNGANHTHSVLRDVDNDFGVDVLREHLLEYHVL